MIAILISGGVAMLAALVGTPFMIRYFRDRGFGQMIRDEGPDSHQAKAGTPTMGGSGIVAAAVLGWLVAHAGSLEFTAAGFLVVGTFVGMAIVGFADDFIKIRMRRNLGLNKTAKFVGQGIIAAVFATLGPLAGLPRNISVTGEIEISLSAAAFFVWIFILLAGTSNAVNLTDGLDGLAAGSSALVFGAYTLIAFWQFRNPEAFGIVDPSDPLEMAVIAMAAMGACTGFLWHNAPPAKIFMGDTGSLPLGGLLAALAVATNTQFLLVLLGALFVGETISVIVQVFAFRVFGNRIFRMTPIHHHFELVGWAETAIMVRFWIVQAIGIALALGAFYAESLPRVVGIGG